MDRVAIYADFLHFTNVPDYHQKTGYDYIQDGLLLIEDGHIAAIDKAATLEPTLDDGVRRDKSHVGKLIIPGMIDIHTHYQQINIIASYGEQLLDWLQQYTFPAEMQFSDKAYATTIAEAFLNECFRNGTTTAMVFCSKHPESVEAFFEVSHQFNARMIAGKVMMDRNAPAALLDTVDSSYTDSKRLIEQWHNKGRQSYAITPRFPPTSSPAQLTKAAQLKEEFSDVYIQSHISENKAEIEWVKVLFPECDNYLDVFARYGLLSDRTILAHGVHLSDDELATMAAHGAQISFCPSSNLFLGSGLFDPARVDAFGVGFGIATDVGAGTSFSMLQTLRSAYEVAQMQQQTMDPLLAFYYVTLGNAKTLKLDHVIGNFELGKEADFVVLDMESTPLLAHRMALCKTLEEKLFALLCLGDDRAVEQTYLMGEKVYDKNKKVAVS